MIIEKHDTDYAVYRIPSLVITDNGTLLACYECRNSQSDWAQIDIKIIRSVDRGDSWQTVEIILGNGHTLNNPMLTSDKGVIHLLYCRDYKELFYKKSADDGESFGKASDITHVFEQNDRFYNVAAIGPGHGIVHNGNILLPVWFAYNHEDEKAHHPSFVKTICSNDSGKTWKLGEIIHKEDMIDPSECALAVWQNKVVISIRNESHCRKRAFAVSENGYCNWSEPIYMDALPDPICMGSMFHTDDALYHINCANTSVRENLTIKISHDMFESYDSVLVDELGGYSDIAVKDGEIYVIYERDIWKPGNLCFKRIHKK
ncbi:MAG: exo-alpha-sialidase [Ruminococcaceae bacterium]|nr:exo-alpha-sialidase [Oscillospiraceae bacterium]